MEAEHKRWWVVTDNGDPVHVDTTEEKATSWLSWRSLTRAYDLNGRRIVYQILPVSPYQIADAEEASLRAELEKVTKERDAAKAVLASPAEAFRQLDIIADVAKLETAYACLVDAARAVAKSGAGVAWVRPIHDALHALDPMTRGAPHNVPGFDWGVQCVRNDGVRYFVHNENGVLIAFTNQAPAIMFASEKNRDLRTDRVRYVATRFDGR